MPTRMVTTITTVVAPINSCFVGQDTLVNCTFTSLIKLIGLENTFITHLTLYKLNLAGFFQANFGKKRTDDFVDYRGCDYGGKNYTA